ncbi:MAG: muramidase [Notoacmeibacter sp.]|nr:muramidase [Notoacmeibacter sp.]
MPGVHVPKFKQSLTGLLAALAFLAPAVAGASDFSRPWQRADTALVIDAYEYNAIDWHKLVTDKRITGFINKASDGLPPKYRCSGNETEVRLCKALWKRYAVAKELYHTRRMMAKTLGLSWGAYHLARPGNPIDQANHFIDFAEPAADELIAIDIEDNHSDWMSLEDAEIFVGHIHKRLGRWPVLYTNGNTSKHIADNRARYPLLSRLNLWYARYKPEIGEHFPKGNWTGYALWQFATQVNCSRRACPYRPPGTPKDIDVNVAAMSPADLKKAWPFSDLVPEIAPEEPMIADAGADQPRPAGEIPLPVLRADALNTAPVLRVVSASLAPLAERLALSYRLFNAETVAPVAEDRDEVTRAPDEAVKAPVPETLVAAYAETGAIWPSGRGAQALAMLDRMATGSVNRTRGPATRVARFAPSLPADAQPEPEVVNSPLSRRVALIGRLGFGEVLVEDGADAP